MTSLHQGQRLEIKRPDLRLAVIDGGRLGAAGEVLHV
jgi:hypothetical protein